MSVTVDAGTVSLSDAVSHLSLAVDELLAASLVLVDDDEVLAAMRALESSRNRLAAVDHRVIEEVESRNLPHRHACASTGTFLKELLRVEPAEATARVAAAHALGARRTLAGEPLEPIYPATGAAIAEGAISPRHAAVIVTMIEKLPVEVRAEVDRIVEDELLTVAREHDPAVLRSFARDRAQRLDQDGQYNEAAYRERTRGVRMTRHADGSAHLDIDATAQAAELLVTLFDATAKPQPANDGTKDARSYAQRCHDGLVQGLKLLLGSGELPASKGVTTTLILTMDADTYVTGHGSATTGHGVTIPADIAKAWIGPEARTVLVLLSKTKGIVGYSHLMRCFTESQRRAMHARDGGCSFPGCDKPAAWSDAHHVREFKDGGPTSVANGALVCDWHHDHFHALGWKSVMINGQPHWVPPKWKDPDQQPRRNSRNTCLPPPPR